MRQFLIQSAARREKLRQRSPGDKLHREVRTAVGERTELVDGHNARVLELSADPGFFDEPPDENRIVAVLLEQDLESQLAAQFRIPAAQDRPHSAPAISPKSW